MPVPGVIASSKSNAAASGAVRFTNPTSPAQNYTVAGTGLNGTDLTMACWMKIAVDTNFYTAAMAIDAAAGATYYRLGTTSTGTDLQFDSTSGGMIPTFPMTVGTWYYEAVVYRSAGTDNLFYAASPATTLTQTDSTITGPAASSTFRIAHDVFNAYLNGSVSCVRVWTAALSKTELETEAPKATQQRTSNLWAAYNFTSGPSTTDNSGNGRTLTATGTPTLDSSGPPIT